MNSTRIPAIGPYANAPMSAGRSEKSNLINPGMIGIGNSRYCSTNASALSIPVPTISLTFTFEFCVVFVTSILFSFMMYYYRNPKEIQNPGR